MKINYVIPKIPLPLRMISFILCETGGIAIQFFLPSLFFLSLVLMVAGSVLLIARNYKNKPLDLGFEDWKPASGIEFERIEQNLKMTKKLSYPFIYKGGFGVVVLVILGIAAFFAFVNDAYGVLILVLDVAIIFFPVSWTGVVQLWTPSELKMKMERFCTIMQEAKKSPGKLIVTPYLRLDKDKEGRQIPEDVRLMIEPKRKPEDFLGAQIQIAINNGPNGAVPYMYAVFLCKGKGPTFEKLTKEKYGSMIKEPGGDNEYGYIVVRQRTGGGGYHTTPNDCIRLFGILKEKLITLS
ncbi:MAG: hypothetical protein JXB88_27325 [Spirochaetales bacterium]|nr:hypothetical protein [Spirochaetales bacterium]